jgi:hypothetical protein
MSCRPWRWQLISFLFKPMAQAKHILRYDFAGKRYFKFNVVLDYMQEISKEEYHKLKEENEAAEKASGNNPSDPDPNATNNP